jgi:hypothetical protein
VPATSHSSGRGRGRGGSSSSSSSGIRRGFLGQPLQQSSWSSEQRQQQRELQQLRAVQMLARDLEEDDDDDTASDGSWETASGEQLHHLIRFGALWLVLLCWLVEM